MLNRILYQIVTLPRLVKVGCLGVTFLLFACTFGTIASIPAARARVAEQTTQTAIAQGEQAKQVAAAQAEQTTQTAIAQGEQAKQVAAAQREQATQATIDTAATSSAEIAATTQAKDDETATSVVVAQQATETAISAATTTAQIAIDATNTAIMMVATSVAASTAAAQPTPVPIAAATIDYKELSRWQQDDKTWVAIKITPGMDMPTLTALALQLREKDVTARYHIFDDDAEIQQFKDSDMNYGDDKFPYPEAWANKHHIAIINLMFLGSNKSEWQLVPDADDSVAIEIKATRWGGTRKDGRLTEAEASGWAALYLKTTESFACCTQAIQVTELRRPVVTATLDGELASRPEKARQGLAAGMITQFIAELGECPAQIQFVSASGERIGDSYQPSQCP